MAGATLALIPLISSGQQVTFCKSLVGPSSDYRRKGFGFVGRALFWLQLFDADRVQTSEISTAGAMKMLGIMGNGPTLRIATQYL
jgi:hypothetical protein